MTLINSKIWLAGTILVALLLLGPLQKPRTLVAQQQTGVVVSLQNRDAEATGEEMVTVDVVVDGEGINLYGAEFQLAYYIFEVEPVDQDPNNQGVQIKPGPLLTGDLTATPGPDFIVARNEDDADLGLITFAITRLNPSQPATQGGVLATVTFQRLNGGHSYLSLGDVVLSDINGRPVPSKILPPIEINLGDTGESTTIGSPDDGLAAAEEEDGSGLLSFLPSLPGFPDIPFTFIGKIIGGLIGVVLLVGGGIFGLKMLKGRAPRNRKASKGKKGKKRLKAPKPALEGA